MNPAVAPTIKPVAEDVMCSYKKYATRYPTKIGIAVDEERRKDLTRFFVQ